MPRCERRFDPGHPLQADLAQLGKRRAAQVREVLGSNPRFGTMESESARVLGLVATECVPAGMAFD